MAHKAVCPDSSFIINFCKHTYIKRWQNLLYIMYWCIHFCILKSDVCETVGVLGLMVCWLCFYVTEVQSFCVTGVFIVSHFQCCVWLADTPRLSVWLFYKKFVWDINGFLCHVKRHVGCVCVCVRSPWEKSFFKMQNKSLLSESHREESIKTWSLNRRKVNNAVVKFKNCVFVLLSRDQIHPVSFWKVLKAHAVKCKI